VIVGFGGRHAVASRAVVVSGAGVAAQRDGVGGAVTAHHGDGVIDLDPLSIAEFGEVCFNAVDEPPDPGDLLLGGGGVVNLFGSSSCRITQGMAGADRPVLGAVCQAAVASPVTSFHVVNRMAISRR